MRKIRISVVLITIMFGVSAIAQANPVSAAAGDPEIIALMNRINSDLAEMGMDMRIGMIELYTIGRGRPANRIHQSGHRWMADDDWRVAQEDDITYLVDWTHGWTSSGLTPAQTEAAIDRSMTTWNGLHAMRKMDIVKRPWAPIWDPTIFDELIPPYVDPDPRPGYPFFADIVHAGWFPRDLFDALVPGGGDFILGFSVTFWWLDEEGNDVDKNGDNYIDTALNEVYFNDNFFWGIDMELPSYDVETVSLHEFGHSLCIGHFGPPPVALMNPVYSGIIHSPYPTDEAGMKAIWSSWPK
ncbi:MAG: hypothetical protein ACFFAJ_07875 [Candidatus Hodarchaeota archaeon]